jgi:phosphoribosyl 1,2-cyclic phosphate phosphodiesterase
MTLIRRKIMKLYFLGTCACDFSPRLKTDLKDCFDKNARRSSALLLDDRFLIDCGVHTLESLGIAKKDISKITDIFITHTHCDHYNEENIRKIAEGRSTPLRVWLREGANICNLGEAKVCFIEHFKEYTEGDISFTAIPANHDPKAAPQHYIFTLGEKKLFYGCDGGWFVNPSFIFLKKQKIDIAVLDCTVGNYDGDFRIGEHNSIPMVKMMLPSLYNVGAIKEDAEIILSHMAPSLHASHEETEKIAATFGARVAYDGLELDL